MSNLDSTYQNEFENVFGYSKLGPLSGSILNYVTTKRVRPQITVFFTSTKDMQYLCQMKAFDEWSTNLRVSLHELALVNRKMQLNARFV